MNASATDLTPHVEPAPAASVLPTLNPDGSRRWLRPRVSQGKFLTWRRVSAYILILVFTAVPYIHLNGRPLILLDIRARRFTLFGETFFPTDTLLLALLIVLIFLSVFFITAIFGRVWCGWACPQTVYMEFVFRPIERLFTGAPGRTKQNRLQRSGMGKPLKFAAYLLVSLYLAHTFLAYFVGVDQLRVWVTRSPLEHPVPFLVMAATTGLMLFDFGYFREQVCLVACPYGRLQSVMLDRQSLIITYDRARGEPRGKARRTPKADADVHLPVASAVPDHAPRGDCVDCFMCVTTCPTGIDIRNGLQMECIGCAQCIDACDAVMTRIGRARGLIRYSSQAAVERERPRILRPRLMVYAALIGVLTVSFVALLVVRESAYVIVTRGVGQPFTTLAPDAVANPIRIKILNRADAPATFTASVAGVPGARLEAADLPATIAPGESRTFPASLIAPAGAFARGKLSIDLHVSADNGFSQVVHYRIVGPVAPRATSRQPAPAQEPPSP